ncbi:hypothetical protein Bhyg_03213 [Pseudolycoriella hygida]|uniref:Uncharacterized protein n=1 Tax=Pseudolycoriella hygida TaxID=35572 RepID=A0A9Q0NCY0_9DIPT|nr:hypothetical protein Bhyg_03213 [Pseudolycoriella hygida]
MIIEVNCIISGVCFGEKNNSYCMYIRVHYYCFDILLQPLQSLDQAYIVSVFCNYGSLTCRAVITMSYEPQSKRKLHDVLSNDESEEVQGSELKKLLLSLSTKVDSLNNAMTDVDNRLNVKIDKLESSMANKIADVKSDMEKRLTSFSSEIDQRLIDAITSTNRKCDDKIVKVTHELNLLHEQRVLNESRLDNLERLSLEKELIITGVPVEQNDEPFGIVGDICKALECNLSKRDFVTAFRIWTKDSNSSSSRSAPILVKVYDAWVKQHLLSAYFKRKNLNLKDIGFQTASRIYINESLTNANRAIFKLTSEAKKANVIASLFSRNGLVHVKRDAKARSTIIYNIGELEQILPSDFKESTTSNVRLTNFRNRRQRLPADKASSSADNSGKSGTCSRAEKSNGSIQSQTSSDIQNNGFKMKELLLGLRADSYCYVSVAATTRSHVIIGSSDFPIDVSPPSHRKNSHGDESVVKSADKERRNELISPTLASRESMKIDKMNGVNLIPRIKLVNQMITIHRNNQMIIIVRTKRVNQMITIPRINQMIIIVRFKWEMNAVILIPRIKWVNQMISIPRINQIIIIVRIKWEMNGVILVPRIKWVNQMIIIVLIKCEMNGVILVPPIKFHFGVKRRGVIIETFSSVRCSKSYRLTWSDLKERHGIETIISICCGHICKNYSKDVVEHFPNIEVNQQRYLPGCSIFWIWKS